MKKYILPIIAIILFITSCEKDDICIDDTTPNLVIRFYDNVNPANYKTVTNLIVWAEGKGPLSDYNNVSKDSIALPLDPAKDFTIYHLSSNGVDDTITINYTRNEIFVSRSCGYKYNFEGLNLSGITNNWILNTQVTNQTIENETEHIKICISIVLITVSFTVNAQEDLVKDSIKLKDKYGLRLGADISKPIITAFNDKIKGFEIAADYRITKKIYAAAELGYYDRNTEEDYIAYNSKGSYIKVGGNINLYQNWGNMSNEIYAGLRYGYSSFSQTLNSYSANFDGTYFNSHLVTPNIKFDGLSAHWVEFVIGLKVEVMNNFYLSSSVNLKNMIQQTQPDNFKNLYIPGFERVYLNNTGFSFNYTISYLIPLYKKNK